MAGYKTTTKAGMAKRPTPAKKTAAKKAAAKKVVAAAKTDGRKMNPRGK
ncbi:hypothetical protein [Streptomyces demainii]|uniref:Topoisomerase IA-like protein n=1 Tax=Streptomyces demainii TaxID=588122 RepID=A0ABT9KVZ0_9ACTN|nr:hypothetical protein [Streptomyces demainii]MDP9611541.1 topoisomerase IA-like protein [Streptomyces demainii]